jgi:hypothetical protein
MLGMVATALVGCRTREVVVTVPEYHPDTLYVAKVERDSVFVQDSVWVREKGDTVLVDRWHVSYKERVRVDTVYEHRIDTVAKVVEVPTGKTSDTKKFTWWQRVRMTLGDIALVLIVAVIVILTVKYILLKVVRP